MYKILYKICIFLSLINIVNAAHHDIESKNIESNKIDSKDSKTAPKISSFYDISALQNNEKIKQLDYEIKALETKAKIDSKWDNPMFSFGYNNAEIMQPFNLNANEMQNIFIGLSQNIDLNAKRKIAANITKKEAQIKLLELKNLKNQYILSLISESININKNKKILEATNSALHNINIVLNSLKSSNYNPLQLQKLNILKAKLQIKQNEIANVLKSSHVSISETSFEVSSELTISNVEVEILRNLDANIILDSIMKSNYEIQAEILRESASLDSIKLARASFLPDVNVGLSYMYRVNRADMFGLSVSLPLAIYGKERATLAQNKLQNLISKSKLKETQNRIKHQVYNLLNNLETLKQNLNLIDKVLLPSNEDIINLYRHHSISQANLFSEFYNAMNDKVEAQILKLEILAQMSIIYYSLEALGGE